MNKDIPADERRDLWEEAHVNEESFDWDYGQWITQALERHLAAVENIVGVDAAAGPLRDLLADAIAAEGEAAESWRDGMEAIGAVGWITWRMGSVFRELGLYGRYGVMNTDLPLNERKASLAGLIHDADAFVRSAGFEQPGGEGTQALKVVRLAQSRRALDTGEGGVDPGSLAILGGWSEGRVRNMMSGADRVLENDGGRVPAASAMAILKDRPAFFDSIWDRLDEAPVNEAPPLDDVFFVPMARDGTVFHPGLHRGLGYTIGEKGQEVTVEIFEEALDALHRMPEPKWRRPNATGNWGLVAGVGWARMPRADLEGIAR